MNGNDLSQNITKLSVHIKLLLKQTNIFLCWHYLKSGAAVGFHERKRDQ